MLNACRSHFLSGKPAGGCTEYRRSHGLLHLRFALEIDIKYKNVQAFTVAINIFFFEDKLSLVEFNLLLTKARKKNYISDLYGLYAQFFLLPESKGPSTDQIVIVTGSSIGIGVEDARH
jgi:hypothetical protein